MMTTMIRVALVLLLTLHFLPAVGAWAEEPATPGISATKPEEGRYVETPRGFMVPYTMQIPGTEISFEMVPIPGGVFRMGSPEDERGRQEVEGPTFEVEIQPFWMGKHEITWEEYKQFMKLYGAFKEFQSRGERLVTDENRVDAITAPTELYDPSFTFEKGEEPRQPAVTMTQYAAKQYTKWLSAITKVQHRLPSEAEWEYACRAGTTTPYSFGDDPGQLEEYAWYYDNSDEKSHPVGQKLPNPWGLHDMHGNVAEWVLDELLPEGYQKFEGKRVTAKEAIVWPQKAYPRVVRGGSWDDFPEACRSASRLGSDDPSWKSEDPNFPLSPWWFTSDPSRGVGFRLVRPLDELPREEMVRYWEIDVEDIEFDVDSRLEEGRGALGLVDPDLPEAIEKLSQ
jgi:formylglycine-generating enzyme